MSSFARRRRARLEARKPFVEDPENSMRQRDCAAQMRAFDQLPPETRRRITEGPHDTDIAGLVRRLKTIGPSNPVREELKRRAVLPCDVPFEELLSIELQLTG